MALVEMLRALEEEASVRVARLRRRAEVEGQALLRAAEERVRPLQEEALAKARLALVGERARRLARARFALRKEVAAVKEELVDQVFRAVEARLGEVRRRPSYPATFRVLATEALVGVTGPATLAVAPPDQELAVKVLAELGLEGEVVANLSTAGGLKVTLGNGRVTIDNTLEARLSRAQAFLRTEVNRRLTEG